MPISQCLIPTDETGRELVQHGSAAFPIACYHDDFRKMDVPWHWHEELEAAIVTEGSCVVAAGNTKFELHAGEGFFINSGVLHSCWDLDATGCRFHSLVFHTRLVGGNHDSVLQNRYITPLVSHPALEAVVLSPSITWQQEALAAIEHACQFCLSEKPGYEFQVRSALSELIYLLWSHMPAYQQGENSSARRHSQRIKAMLSFIHSHYSEDLSIRHIAASAMISQSECLRCFRCAIGTTPIQYVKQYRIQQAALQLSTTADRISEIAARCGFQDMSYFSKTFRSLKGCTPSAYRSSI